MQLVLEVYPGLSNLGPEKASIQLMKGSKAALERNKKFKGLRDVYTNAFFGEGITHFFRFGTTNSC